MSPAANMTTIEDIEVHIKFESGEEIIASIYQPGYGGWQQWNGYIEELNVTMPIVEALSEAAYEVCMEEGYDGETGRKGEEDADES